ncbi:hypothetical protein CPB85DRAFT_1460822 [Mucidula mucida]|nr:hypothetical protein CPB85DRAFT_1460822 [Mucidula mucida]
MHFVSHIQDLASLDFETIPKGQQHQTVVNVCLALEAVRRFYNPASATYTATFNEQLPHFATLFYSLILNTLYICACTDDPSFYIATARVIQMTLCSLFCNEAGFTLFTLSPALPKNMQLLITTWATFSSGDIALKVDMRIVDIINNLFEYQPTKQAVEYAASSIPKSKLSGAVQRLLETACGVYNPSFPLSSDTLTRVRGVGLIGQIRPAIRHTFFRSGVLKCLCDILKHIVIDENNSSPSWETQNYTAHEQAVVVAQELYLLLKDEVSSPRPILDALNAGILNIVVHAVARFGNNRLLPVHRRLVLEEQTGGSQTV